MIKCSGYLCVGGGASASLQHICESGEMLGSLQPKPWRVCLRLRPSVQVRVELSCRNSSGLLRFCFSVFSVFCGPPGLNNMFLSIWQTEPLQIRPASFVQRVTAE